ncbi:hypothetical protein MMC06_004301 [Schaereria dolodes]|nr:hypothetical protein [Schaereria dolodes]
MSSLSNSDRMRIPHILNPTPKPSCTPDRSPSPGPSSDESAPYIPNCIYTKCNLRSPRRKVVSHFFGRNKTSTRSIPAHVWVYYCRKHYQRSKYRAEEHEYALNQIDLVKRQVDNIMAWGGARSCELALRKRALDRLIKEDRHQVACLGVPSEKQPQPLQGPNFNARWLLKYLGPDQSFAKVRAALELIEKQIVETNCPMPDFEILINFKQDSVPIKKARSPKAKEPLMLPFRSKRTAGMATTRRADKTALRKAAR